jgi:hypothetical protein
MQRSGGAACRRPRPSARNARTAAERATASCSAQGFVSQAALDMAETQLQGHAGRSVQQAQAARRPGRRWRAALPAVTAPFDGVVLATHLSRPVTWPAPGRAIATLYAPGALRAVVQVPSVAARRWRARPPASTGASCPTAPVMQARAPQDELASGRPGVADRRMAAGPAGGSALPGLVPGQVARVHFSGAAAPATAAGAPSTLRLPVAAVLRRGELNAVYVAQGDGFALRAVRLGAERADGIDVLAGLKPGDKVAANAVRGRPGRREAGAVSGA